MASIHGPGFSPRAICFGDVDLAVAVRVAGGAHRRDAAREIEAREALGEIAVDAGARGVVEMLVHHHEPGDDGLAGEIDDLRAGGRLRRCGIADRGDASVAHDDRLIVARRGAGAIDHANVREHDGGRVDGDVLAHVGRERRALGGERRGGEKRCRGEAARAHRFAIFRRV